MQFKGSAEFEEFWSYLEGESPRGAAIVVAAYFDEKLADLLGQTHQTFFARINDAFVGGLLTQNERDDLHVIREMRNSFAHDLRAKDFDSAKAQQVDSMKTWQVAVNWLPRYAELFPTPKDRMLYVTGAFYVRLNHRVASGAIPPPEPDIGDTDAFPVVGSR